MEAEMYSKEYRGVPKYESRKKYGARLCNEHGEGLGFLIVGVSAEE